MAPRIARSSVDAVMGRLFETPPKYTGPKPSHLSRRAGGGRSSTRGGHLAKVATRRPGVMFKNISRAGAKSARGLRGQMRYIFDKEKVGYVFDSRGRYDGLLGLDERRIRAVARSWEASWAYKTNLGNTSHMLISFPPGTDPDRVVGIAQDVCQEMFGDPETGFDYVAALHTDTNHPHVHIILNRFGRGGQLFKLSRDSQHSYEAFRELIVERAEEFGIKLSNHRRFERGHVDRPQSSDRVQQEKRDPMLNAPVLGPAAPSKLVLKDVSETADLYAAAAFLAGTMNLKTLQAAHESAAQALRSGSTFAGDRTMNQEHATEAEQFDTALVELRSSLGKLQSNIEKMDGETRPSFERVYASVIAQYADIVPDSQDAQMLRSEAGFLSPYKDGFVIDRDGTRDAAVKAAVETSLEQSGLDVAEVLARVRAGADNEYLEQTWIRSDVERVGQAKGLDLNEPKELAAILKTLGTAYDEVRADLIQYRVCSMRPEYRHVSSGLSLIEGVHPPMVHNIGIEELKEAQSQFEALIETEALDADLIADEMQGYAADLTPAEAKELAERYLAVAPSLQFYEAQALEKQRLTEAGLPHPLVDLAHKLAFYRAQDQGNERLVQLVTNDEMADSVDAYRLALGDGLPTRETIRAQLEAAAPELERNTLDELAERLHRGQELSKLHAERQPIVHEEDRFVTRIASAFDRGSTELPDADRAKLIKLLASRMSDDDKLSAERGETSSMARFADSTNAQSLLTFYYVKDLYSSGRKDLFPAVEKLSKEKAAIQLHGSPHAREGISSSMKI